MYRLLVLSASIVFLALGLKSAHGQRLAIVVPQNNEISNIYAERLRDAFVAAGKRVIDQGASDAAYRTVEVETPFNMSTDDARKSGETIGSDVFVLVKGQTQQRTSLETRGYYESSAAVFVVSSRSGKLIHWGITASEAASSSEAEASLLGSVDGVAGAIIAKAEKAYRSDLARQNSLIRFPEVPPDASPESRGLRPPVPYNRIKPVYTDQAYLYGVRATVDAEVNIDESGKIADIDIVRWAGYGLEESVIEAIRSMNWRPAERNGKQLPMLILLRYNFKKIDKEDQ